MVKISLKNLLNHQDLGGHLEVKKQDLIFVYLAVYSGCGLSSLLGSVETSLNW